MISWCLAHPWLAIGIAAAVVLTLADMAKTLYLPEESGWRFCRGVRVHRSMTLRAPFQLFEARPS